jgi:hypothetical protein
MDVVRRVKRGRRVFRPRLSFSVATVADQRGWLTSDGGESYELGAYPIFVPYSLIFISTIQRTTTMEAQDRNQRDPHPIHPGTLSILNPVLYAGLRRNRD